MAKKADAATGIPEIVAALGLPGQAALVALQGVIQAASAYETALRAIDSSLALKGMRRGRRYSIGSARTRCRADALSPELPGRGSASC